MEEQAFQAVKLAVALNFRNFSINTELPLLMMVDSSKVVTSYMSFQIVEGEIHIIDMDSRVFSEPEMGAPSVTREALGICYGLRKMEVSIRAHPLKTVLFTDCSSLIFFYLGQGVSTQNIMRCPSFSAASLDLRL